MPEDPLVSTAERTLRLIELLLAEPDGLTPQEILLNLDVSRSTLFILLRTLKTLGYVEQSERRGRYHCGPRLLAWRTMPGDHRQDLLTAFYQEVGRQNWPETMILVMPTAEGSQILGQIEGQHPVRSVYNPGQNAAEITAAARILSTNPDQTTIQNGYTLEIGRHMAELALPVCPEGSQPGAAIVLSVPVYRWQSDPMLGLWLPELRALAARLSYRMGALYYSPYRGQSPKELPGTGALDAVEITSFLQGPWAARLACIRPDGRPHVIPVWQEWDGQAFTIIAWQGSQWADFVFQNPNISLTVDEPWPPLRRIVARGKASALPYTTGSPELNQLLQRLTHRYLGQSATAQPVAQVARAFRIELESLRGWQGLPGPAIPTA